MTTTSSDTPAKVLSMRLDAQWSFVDDIRRLVENFCAAAADADQGGEVALAAHELIQNAIANASTPFIELELAVDGRDRGVELAVSHACAPDRVARLRAKLSRLYGYADALQGYLATMAENPDGTGGLGLARVRYESGLDLAVVEGSGRVTVRAFRGAQHLA